MRFLFYNFAKVENIFLLFFFEYFMDFENKIQNEPRCYELSLAIHRARQAQTYIIKKKWAENFLNPTCK